MRCLWKRLTLLFYLLGESDMNGISRRMIVGLNVFSRYVDRVEIEVRPLRGFETLAGGQRNVCSMLDYWPDKRSADTLKHSLSHGRPYTEEGIQSGALTTMANGLFPENGLPKLAEEITHRVGNGLAQRFPAFLLFAFAFLRAQTAQGILQPAAGILSFRLNYL